MTKRLELLFINEGGKNVTISVDDPKEPVNAQEVTEAMDAILLHNAFVSPQGYLVQKRGARVVERNVETVDIEI
ncbi:MAG: DUF2922 domain-containing protein [Bacillus sp. (in: Bacteria)]|nr:DUF2922 domain-containing protein [Bacillus sp. (in: firmicutes)]